MKQANDARQILEKPSDAEVHQALLLLLRQLAQEIAKELHAQSQKAKSTEPEIRA